MHIARPLIILVLGSSAPVWAQSSAPSLDLQLPTEAVAQIEPAAESKPNSDSAESAAPVEEGAPEMPQPYDEPYGTRRDAQKCDDKTYAQPQVHGSVGMGVMSGNHVSGNYQTGTITASKALGTCDDQKGLVSATISVSKGNLKLRQR